jgi:hypothetical protein
MVAAFRWDPSIAHRGAEAEAFIGGYFGANGRRVLFVGGAGFDPRSCTVAKRMAAASPDVRAVLIQEDRPNPSEALVARASANRGTLLSAFKEPQLASINIFGADGAVVGGRNVIGELKRAPLHDVDDVVVDISALSVGTSFPVIRYFVEHIERRRSPGNLHVFVAHDPQLDADIRSIPGDAPGYVHGFKGAATLDRTATAAKLWLPQLAAGRRAALGHLYDFVEPHDTCPILPFPSVNPRLGDELAEEYLSELESGWSVDTRNIVYADEGDPLDLYRTILRLDDLRKPVFAETGGSLLVLSPFGSKVMALGALLAALERDLPVAHLEPIGYQLPEAAPQTANRANLVHVWLEGDVYPSPRPALRTEGMSAA